MHRDNIEKLAAVLFHEKGNSALLVETNRDKDNLLAKNLGAGIGLVTGAQFKLPVPFAAPITGTYLGYKILPAATSLIDNIGADKEDALLAKKTNDLFADIEKKKHYEKIVGKLGEKATQLNDANLKEEHARMLNFIAETEEKEKHFYEDLPAIERNKMLGAAFREADKTEIKDIAKGAVIGAAATTPLIARAFNASKMNKRLGAIIGSAALLGGAAGGLTSRPDVVREHFNPHRVKHRAEIETLAQSML